jgi:hypothetical protein
MSGLLKYCKDPWQFSWRRSSSFLSHQRSWTRPESSRQCFHHLLRLEHDTSVGWSQRAVDRAQPAVRSNEAVDGYSRSTVPLMSHPRPLSRVRIRMGVEFV